MTTDVNAIFTCDSCGKPVTIISSGYAHLHETADDFVSSFFGGGSNHQATVDGREAPRDWNPR